MSELFQGNERRIPDDHEFYALRDQLNRQDDVLLSLRDTLNEHIIESRDIGPTLKEMVVLWKASKLLVAIITVLAAGTAGLWSLFVWARGH